MKRFRPSMWVGTAAVMSVSTLGLLFCDTPQPSNVSSEFIVTGLLQTGTMPSIGPAPLCNAPRAEAGAVDASTTSVTAGASNVWFVAQVCTPEGTWQLGVSVDGALTSTSTGTAAADAAPSTAMQSFSSDGVHAVQLVFGLTSAATTTGSATVRTTVGGVTQSFDYTVSAKPQSTCITVPSSDLLAWSVIPAPPLFITDADTVIPDGAALVGQLTVDVRVQLSLCPADGGASDGSAPDCGATDNPLGNKAVSVAGTGGLAPTSATFMTDFCGFGVYELRGPAVVDAATAVLTYQQGSAVVTVPEVGGM
jgi:hypothetical protein